MKTYRSREQVNFQENTATSTMQSTIDTARSYSGLGLSENDHKYMNIVNNFAQLSELRQEINSNSTQADFMYVMAVANNLIDLCDNYTSTHGIKWPGVVTRRYEMVENIRAQAVELHDDLIIKGQRLLQDEDDSTGYTYQTILNNWDAHQSNGTLNLVLEDCQHYLNVAKDMQKTNLGQQRYKHVQEIGAQAQAEAEALSATEEQFNQITAKKDVTEYKKLLELIKICNDYMGKFAEYNKTRIGKERYDAVQKIYKCTRRKQKASARITLQQQRQQTVNQNRELKRNENLWKQSDLSQTPIPIFLEDYNKGWAEFEVVTKLTSANTLLTFTQDEIAILNDLIAIIFNSNEKNNNANAIITAIKTQYSLCYESFVASYGDFLYYSLIQNNLEAKRSFDNSYEHLKNAMWISSPAVRVDEDLSRAYGCAIALIDRFPYNLDPNSKNEVGGLGKDIVENIQKTILFLANFDTVQENYSYISFEEIAKGLIAAERTEEIIKRCPQFERITIMLKSFEYVARTFGSNITIDDMFSGVQPRVRQYHNEQENRRREEEERRRQEALRAEEERRAKKAAGYEEVKIKLPADNNLVWVKIFNIIGEEERLLKTTLLKNGHLPKNITEVSEFIHPDRDYKFVLFYQGKGKQERTAKGQEIIERPELLAAQE